MGPMVLFPLLTTEQATDPPRSAAVHRRASRVCPLGRAPKGCRVGKGIEKTRPFDSHERQIVGGGLEADLSAADAPPASIYHGVPSVCDDDLIAAPLDRWSRD